MAHYLLYFVEVKNPFRFSHYKYNYNSYQNLFIECCTTVIVFCNGLHISIVELTSLSGFFGYNSRPVTLLTLNDLLTISTSFVCDDLEVGI